MSKIQVAILTETPGGSATLDVLKGLFIPEAFTVMLYGTTNYEETFYNALRSVAPDTYCIIMRETSVTNSDPTSVREIINEAIGSSVWDVCYLCRWLDRCDLYQNVVSIPGRASNIVKTVSPHGTQALLFSPKGRNIILGKERMKNGKYFNKNSMLGPTLHEEITRGNIEATCMVPNLFEFNILEGSPRDALKTSGCAQSRPNQEGFPGWIYFILIGIIVILIILFMMKR